MSDDMNEFTLCEDTGALTYDGQCVTHGGDACLKTYAWVGRGRRDALTAQRWSPEPMMKPRAPHEGMEWALWHLASAWSEELFASGWYAGMTEYIVDRLAEPPPKDDGDEYSGLQRAVRRLVAETRCLPMWDESVGGPAVINAGANYGREGQT